jgi:hypothetical protein
VPERDQRLLSEISHELGNYFHKLYYWAELLREQRPAGSDGEPAELLERTIRDLETFLKTALEFFRPLSIAPLAMSIADVVASSRVLLARHAEPTPLAWDEPRAPEAGVVAIDPGRFSFVLEGLVRRLHAPDTTGYAGRAEVEQGEGGRRFVLTVHARGGTRAAMPSVAGAIEWAIIERIVELHGGAVALDVTPQQRSARVQLPVGA